MVLSIGIALTFKITHDVYADDEIYLCGSSGYHFHECLECIPVAQSNYDRQQSADHADADCKPGVWIYDRLRRTDAWRIVLLDFDCGGWLCLFCISAAHSIYVPN